ncbi:MAG: hypothetical protein IJ496_01150 [Ruminococcus sp.]|nr:hypothetical protein [Ruminococcus sp.]
MKRNFYDIFDHWNEDLQELPDLREQSINSKAVADRVMQQAGIRPVQKRRQSYRLFGIAAAAAVLAGGTLTAGAVSGKMEQFFSAVSGAEIRDADAEESLPGVGLEQSEEIGRIESYYSCPDVTFTRTDTATVELLGLYNDHNTLMLSMQMTVQDGTVFTEDMAMLPYFTLTLEDGTEKKLSQSGFLSEPFRKSDTEENVYNLTYYLVESDISGATLNVDLAGVYTQEAAQAVNEKLCALQEDWRAQYFTEDMTTSEWKQLWQEMEFDRLTEEAMAEGFARQAPVLAGSWSAEIPISEPAAEPMVIETDHNLYVLDDLSVYISDTSDSSAEYHCGTAFGLKDGTVLITDSAILQNIQTDEGRTQYQNFAYIRGVSSEERNGSVYCYSRPVHPDEVETITEYYYDENQNGKLHEYVIYQAE